jgi:hypothetical protein
LKKAFSIAVIFFLSTTIIFSQNNLFIKNNKLNPDFNLDSKKIGIELNNKKSLIIIKGVVFDASLLQNELNPLENWIIPFSISNLNINFDVYPNTNQTGINVNIQNNTPELKTFNVKRSTLFIFVRDSLTNNYLDQNLLNLSLEKLSKSNFSIYQLNDIKNLEDFKWKTNQLIHNLNVFQENKNNKEITTIKKVFFQLTASSSIIKTQNKQFNNISNQEFNLSILSSNKKRNIFFGAGISVMKNEMKSINNEVYSSKINPLLELTYTKINELSENYSHQNISINSIIEIYFLNNKKNRFSIYLSPYYSIMNRFSSEIVNGSIETYGKFNGINEQIRDIPELGLTTKSNELIGKKIYYNSSSYGLNIGFKYNLNFRETIIAPSIKIHLISLNNENRLTESYTLLTENYNGLFATIKNTQLIFPTVGLSILF